jgi:NAD(P)-dependent dehydrogenase (short-subunit alcohol dehydrogenase family)
VAPALPAPGPDEVLLAGRIAVVTGIGPGLGRSIALALAREGADLALAARRAANLAPVAAEIEKLGRRALWLPTDVSSAADCERLVQRAVGELGGVDIAVNSAAAFGPRTTFAQADLAGWHEAMNTSFFGALQLTRACLPSMRGRGGGRVVMIGSMATRDPRPGEGSYAAAKAALLMATRTLAVELGCEGIRVNAVNPGYIQGEPIQQAFARRARARGITPAQVEAEVVERSALGYIPAPDEIAGSVVFLCSDLSRPITGHVLDCNAGMWL